jgi:hypothetical protein
MIDKLLKAHDLLAEAMVEIRQMGATRVLTEKEHEGLNAIKAADAGIHFAIEDLDPDSLFKYGDADPGPLGVDAEHIAAEHAADQARMAANRKRVFGTEDPLPKRVR